MDGWIWVAILGAALGYEIFAVVRPNDRFRPLTFHVRRLLLHDETGRNPRAWRSIFYWLLAGLLIWVCVHFLIENVFA